MTTPDRPSESSEAPTRSDETAVEIHLLACGHGDTILLHLPGDRWILVDCYLPKDGGIRDKFFDFVESRRIRRLEYVFQTHPDEDHFWGMRDVLDYFTTEGRSIGCWCDAGINAKQVRGVLFEDIETKERYYTLRHRVDELLAAGTFALRELDENHERVSVKGCRGRVELYAIGPNPEIKRLVTTFDLAKLRDNADARPEANDLSVVLVLSVREDDAHCNILLGGDAGTEPVKIVESRPVPLTLALQAWGRKANEIECCSGFSVVKVPHHGSIRSRSAELCQARCSHNDEAVAAISAGAREGLPHPDILMDYLKTRWVVLVTTTRTRPVRFDHPGALASRRSRRETRLSYHDLTISWTPARGLSYGPQDAIVREEDVVHYQSG